MRLILLIFSLQFFFNTFCKEFEFTYGVYESAVSISSLFHRAAERFIEEHHICTNGWIVNGDLYILVFTGIYTTNGFLCGCLQLTAPPAVKCGEQMGLMRL